MNWWKTLALSAGLGFCSLGLQAQIKPSTPTKNGGYHIRVKLDNYDNDTLILGYRLGSKTYVKDTCIGKNKNGEWVFKKDETLEGGLYIILLKPDNIYFEFLVPDEKDQQNLSLYTKPEGKDLIKNLKIQGSKDNTLFLDYLAFINSQRQKAEDLNNKITEAESKQETEKVAEYRKKLENINKEVLEYQNNLVRNHPKSLSASLLSASQMPEVPKEIQDQGQEAAYRYYKAHYFDGFNWSDPRLIRTPIMEEKIETYLEKLVFQIPDSVIQGVEDIMHMVEKGGDKEVYKYVTAHLLNKYAASKVICMDAVYVHIGRKYYCGARKPEWVEAEQLQKICENVAELEPVLCGRPAPPIQLRDIATGNPVSLYSTKADYTIVYFWDPTCGNCTKASEAMVPIYKKFKDKNVLFLGICSKTWNEVDQCKEKIKDKQLEWINLSDESYPLAIVKKYYDIKMNPYIYLLDKDKKIMFKRLDPQQVEEILDRELNKDKEKPKSGK
jgi:peroxiredoxin